MTFRIQTSTDQEGVTFSLSGQLDTTGFSELQKLLDRSANGHPIIIDLRDIQLVDRYGVAALAACERAGIELRNCPAYVRDWMSREIQNGKGPN
jgi:anti-anti-sigma regulatory factor